MAEDIIRSGTKVAEYLQAQGYDIRKSAVYNHIRDGKLQQEKKGGYSVAAVERYAKRWLAAGPVAVASPELTDLQEKKLEMEVRKLEAQADHWRLKTNVDQGLYIEREQVERDLAARASVLKSDLQNFFRSRVEELIAIVDGDPQKAPDMIEACLSGLESWMDRYSEEGREWEDGVREAETEGEADDE
jgi:hypothetical protein